jgi:tetratricopeptide (TPR) repeat protein
LSEPIDRAAAYRVFCEALELETGQRDALIAARCADTPALERMVRRLLDIASTNAATGLLLAGAGPAVPDRIGREYGRFRLLELLGVGGMGAVYRAERTDGVPQTVALKVLSDVVSTATGGQFAREARILAGLEHPSIARLIDVGIRDGEAWIAMELVRGQAITEYCDARGLDVALRVRLLIAVADAIVTAHRRLIVHRDIKPTNVLVTQEGHPKLIDFGIASTLQGRDDEKRAPTVDISRLFTPHYAAPEQVKGEPVTVATDVFGLGALAYRVLTGCEPFAQATSAVGYLLAVTQSDVQMPSAAARAAGKSVGLARRIEGDLDSILMKALEREPSRRYAGVQELQSDLQAYLEGLPVTARTASWPYRLAKFARRRALSLSIASLIALSLVVASVIYGMQERRVSQAREAAASRGEFLARLLTSADPHSGRRDVTVAELLDSAERSLDQSLGKEPLAEASMLGLIADTNSGLGRYVQGLAASDRQLALLQAHGGRTLDLARALTTRGELLRGYGHYAEGIPVLRRAVALLVPLSGVDEDRAVASNELGEVLANTGAEQEAESLFRQAVDLDRHLRQERRSAAGAPLQNLAVLLSHEGRNEESVAVAREALAVMQQYLPADQPELLTSEQTYAMVLLNANAPARAEPVLRSLVTRSARVRGPDHPDTLVAKVQLGEVLIDLGRYAEAEALIRPTAVALDQIQGPEAPYATGAWSDFVVAACSGTDGAAGLEAAQRIDAIRTKTLAATDWHRISIQTDIGLCLVRLHRYREAEPLLRKSAADLEASRGVGFYTTQLTYKALRELYQQTGRAADAARLSAKITH